MRRLSRRLLLCGLLGSVAGGCLSPTLPLPPPEEPEVEWVGEGLYRLSGSIPVPGRVLAENLDTRLTFGERTERFYSFVVEARPGDWMALWYEIPAERSQPVRFQIEPDRFGAADGGVDGSGRAADLGAVEPDAAWDALTESGGP